VKQDELLYEEQRRSIYKRVPSPRQNPKVTMMVIYGLPAAKAKALAEFVRDHIGRANKNVSVESRGEQLIVQAPPKEQRAIGSFVKTFFPARKNPTKPIIEYLRNAVPSAGKN
jgi:hypothetical protein